jgi:hypothetical protein
MQPYLAPPVAAAIIMAVVFISFASIDEILVKMIGVGLATAVMIDATIIRIVLAPAVMSLLGHRAWWPSHSSRVSRHQARRTRREPSRSGPPCHCLGVPATGSTCSGGTVRRRGPPHRDQK